MSLCVCVCIITVLDVDLIVVRAFSGKTPKVDFLAGLLREHVIIGGSLVIY